MMKRLSIMAPLALLVTGCVDIPETTPTPTGLVFPLFDPVGNADATPPIPAVIPTPTDLAKDRGTGLLAGVPDKPGISEAEKKLNAYLRTLNGFPTTATAEVKFSGKLKAASVTADAVQVWDLTDKKKLTGLILEYREDAKVVNDIEGAKSVLRIWNPAGWERAKQYAIYVLTGDKGLKDAAGKDLIRSALFELAIGTSPLCAWKQTYTWDASKKVCTDPGGQTGVALGCCTSNYSALVESSVAKKVYAGAAEGVEHEELEKQVRQAVLESVSQFEAMRLGYDQLVKATGVKREQVVILWNFSTVGMTEAVFNPAGSPPQLPRPTDLVRDPVTKRLVVPMAANASEAEKEFNAYLAELDGWHLTSAPSVEFTGKLDPASISSTSGGKTTMPYKLYEVDLSTGAPKLSQVAEDSLKAIYSDGGYCALNDPADCTAAYAPKPCTKDNECGAKETCKFVPSLTLSRADGLKRGTMYLVLAMAGADGLKNKDTSVADAPIRSALMHLTLLSEPLCTWDSAKKACSDAGVSTFIDDPKTIPGARTGEGKATIFETIRRGNDALLKSLEAVNTSFKREDVIAAWTFTTTTLSEMAYDVTGSVIPFPNAVLMNQTTGKVNLPSGVVDAELTAGLNKLDGFTNQGPAWAPYFGDVDASTVGFGKSNVAIDLVAQLPLPAAYSFKVDAKAGAIVSTPTAPLKEGGNYALVVYSRMEKGSHKAKGGLTDAAGNRVIPSTFLALIRNRNKLFDKCQSQVSSLGPALAFQAETARVAHKPLFDALEGSFGIPREDVATAWTYQTQTFTKQLTDLRAKAVTKMTGAAAPKLTGALDSTLTGWPAAAPSTDIGGWVPAGTFKTWIALDETKGTFHADAANGKAADVPFMMTVPKTAAPAAGWPVVIFNHALYRSRADFMGIANTLAKVGLATVAFDTIYHGARSWCTEDAHCDGGTCAVATGKCSSKLKVDATGLPAASGQYFVNTDNALAFRDNMQQHAIDVAALVRAIAAPAITGGTVKLDSDKIYLLGQNIGSNLGVVAMATEPKIKRGVFNTGGAPLTDVLIASSATKALIDQVLKKFDIKRDTKAYLQLLTIFHTVLDPADAGNWAGSVGATDAMVQLAGKDTVFPTSFGQHLATGIGTATTDTIFANQGHSFMLKPDPATSVAATGAAQTQVAKFFLTGAICKPNTTTGACN